jgi:hypothetical protein
MPACPSLPSQTGSTCYIQAFLPLPQKTHIVDGAKRHLLTLEYRFWQDMFEAKIFEAALSIHQPWYIKDVQFDVSSKRLDIYIDFKKGSTFLSTKS